MEMNKDVVTVGGIAAALLSFLARAYHMRHRIRTDAVEGDLFENLSSALRRAEERMDEEREMFRLREAAHEARYVQSMEKLLEVTTTLAVVKAKLEAAETQNDRLFREMEELRAAIQRHQG